MHKTLQNFKGWSILCKQDQAPNVNGQVQHLSAIFVHDIQLLHNNQLPNLLITVLIVKVPIWSCRRLYGNITLGCFQQDTTCMLIFFWLKKKASEIWKMTCDYAPTCTRKQHHQTGSPGSAVLSASPHPRQRTALVLAKNKHRKLLEHCGKIVRTVIFHAASSFSSSREHIWGCCHNIVPVGEW